MITDAENKKYHGTMMFLFYYWTVMSWYNRVCQTRVCWILVIMGIQNVK